MASERQLFTFGDAPLEIIDGDRGVNYPGQDEFADEGFCLFLNAGNVTSRGFEFATCAFIGTDREAKLRKGKLQREDIVLTTRGTVGNVAHYSASVPFDHIRINSGMVIVRPNVIELIPRFLYLFMRSPLFQSQMRTLSTGSAQPQLPIRDLNKATIEIPSIGEQEAIVEVLGAFDDRIEIIAAANKTLEDLARAIFKSWFVDFDPVRAKAEGRESEGMVATTAALFPSGFEQSVLGAVPTGWEVGRLEDLLVLQRGFDLPANSRTVGKYPVIAASGASGTHDEPRVKGPGVVTGRSGILGGVYWVDEDFWPLNTSLWVKEFKRSRPAYAFQLLRRLDLSAYNAGSAVPTLNRNHVHGLPTLLPPIGLVEAFDELALSLHAKVRVNRTQSSTLCELRDTLLPRLISGKLRVPEAEKMVEAVI